MGPTSSCSAQLLATTTCRSRTKLCHIHRARWRGVFHVRQRMPSQQMYTWNRFSCPLALHHVISVCFRTCHSAKILSCSPAGVLQVCEWTGECGVVDGSDCSSKCVASLAPLSTIANVQTGSLQVPGITYCHLLGSYLNQAWTVVQAADNEPPTTVLYNGTGSGNATGSPRQPAPAGLVNALNGGIPAASPPESALIGAPAAAPQRRLHEATATPSLGPSEGCPTDDMIDMIVSSPAWPSIVRAPADILDRSNLRDRASLFGSLSTRPPSPIRLCSLLPSFAPAQAGNSLPTVPTTSLVGQAGLRRPPLPCTAAISTCSPMCSGRIQTSTHPKPNKYELLAVTSKKSVPTNDFVPSSTAVQPQETHSRPSSAMHARRRPSSRPSRPSSRRPRRRLPGPAPATPRLPPVPSAGMAPAFSRRRTATSPPRLP